MAIPKALIAFTLHISFIESALGELVDSNVRNLVDDREAFLRGSLAEPRELRYYSSGHTSGKSAFGGLIAGIIIWCLIPPCLWNNERIAIKQSKIQAKARHATVIVQNNEVDPIPPLEGHILFVQGQTTVAETLKDKYFPSVTTTNCIKLRRVVEMYQWVEQEKTEKRGEQEVKYYDYSKQWKDETQKTEHDTDGQHRNPPMTLPSSKRAKEAYQAWAAASNGNGEECEMAKEVKFGKYYCGDFVVRELQNWKPTKVDSSQLSSLTDREVRNKGGPKEQKEDVTWFLYGDGNTIGDYRVRFEQLECGDLSVNGCLAKTAKGYTFVPIIHEDSSMSESLCTEFGFDCGASSGVVYTGKEQQQDTAFIQKLEEIGGPEMTPDERQKFQRKPSTSDVKDYTDDGKSDFCCTCCCPAAAVTGAMHYIGLEEEYLGVKEAIVDHGGMMGQEKESADRRHNLCRIVGLLTGVLGAFFIISPITNLLTSNFLIAILGGALISCALQILACMCSSIAVTAIISAAWIRHRPRVVIISLVTVLALWGGILAAFRGDGSVGGVSTTVAPPLASGATAMTTLAPVTNGLLASPTVAPATSGFIAADGAAPAASGSIGTCASYVASCPPGTTRTVSTTPCSSSPCAWSDCCITPTKLKRRLVTSV